MEKQADSEVSKAFAFGRPGSNPGSGTQRGVRVVGILGVAHNHDASEMARRFDSCPRYVVQYEMV